MNSRPAIAKKLFFNTALSIIFTTIFRNGLKKLQCERTFIPCETSFEKRQVFKCWKCSGVKVWQSHFKEIIELMITLIIMILFQIVIEKDILYKKSWSSQNWKVKKFLLLNITTLVKLNYFWSVPLALFSWLLIFLFFYPWFSVINSS